MSRRRKGSQHRKKAARTLGRRSRRIAHQRADTLQQLTTRLATTKAVIVIEELNVAGLLTHRHLAQAIADVGFSACTRQLRSQAAWYGSRVVLADRWYPSSRCVRAVAGWTTSSRWLTGCFAAATPQHPDCAVALDRDLNAAKNRADLAGSASESRNACGAGSAGLSQTAQVELAVRKQQPDAFAAAVANGKFWRTDTHHGMVRRGA